MASADALKASVGACQICGNTQDLRVDHDHATEPAVIRGVLCNNCNTGVGMLGDDPECLELAAAYLRNPPIGKTVNAIEATP
jgi:Recombination endonuclease VII